MTAPEFRCERLSCRLEPVVCALRHLGSRERYAHGPLLACRGCETGAAHMALLPAEALRRGPRKPSATLRAWETARRPGHWIPLPDPRPR